LRQPAAEAKAQASSKRRRELNPGRKYMVL
jgi:hypothetical protein